jgi:hypothetical protein
VPVDPYRAAGAWWQPDVRLARHGQAIRQSPALPSAIGRARMAREKAILSGLFVVGAWNDARTHRFSPPALGRRRFEFFLVSSLEQSLLKRIKSALAHTLSLCTNSRANGTKLQINSGPGSTRSDRRAVYQARRESAAQQKNAPIATSPIGRGVNRQRSKKPLRSCRRRAPKVARLITRDLNRQRTRPRSFRALSARNVNRRSHQKY